MALPPHKDVFPPFLTAKALLGTFRMLFDLASDNHVIYMTYDYNAVGLIIPDRFHLIPPVGPGFDATPAIECYWAYDKNNRRGSFSKEFGELMHAAATSFNVEGANGKINVGGTAHPRFEDYATFVEAMKMRILPHAELPEVDSRFIRNSYAGVRPYLHKVLLLPLFPWAAQPSIP
ncbi:hypothetical protein H9P43_003453 [Blastocladiella emersonii ATCC 22665]|nr:hypothetical protein H9P43_003453 [Blastocladiella emersonii ATCC 22665]